MRYIVTILLSAILASTAWSAEYTTTWSYTPPTEPAVVGFKLWRGTAPYTLVAEFPSWARGGRWTQDVSIASGEAFTLTAVFADSTESPRSAVYVYPMGDGSTGVRGHRFKSVAGVVAAPLTKQNGARLR